jgi:spermidine synthase
MNVPYPLIPVLIIILTLYCTTWLFSRLGLLTKRGHRKWWNSLLLGTFLVTGISGILSVIKINYKITIPSYDMWLQWHVTIGTAMVFIVFIHLSWNLKYYTRILKKPRILRTAPAAPRSAASERNHFGVLLFLLGVATLITQVLFIREFISVMAGNELVVGIVMACWMLLTALGAHAGRKRLPRRTDEAQGIKMLGFLILTGAAMIVLLYFLKYLLFPPGTLVGLGTVLLASLFLLFPVCFLSGFLFPFFSARLSELKNQNLIGRSYALESWGSLTGSLLFSIFLGKWLNSFQVLGLLAGIMALCGALIVKPPGILKKSLLLALGILLPVTVYFFNPDTEIQKILFPNQEIQMHQSTPYGNLVVTRQAGQYNFYLDNTLQFYTENIISNEEAVHFAMVRHNQPENILLLSGGIAGMIHEILKYPIRNVDYLEINPSIVQYWEKSTGTIRFPEKIRFIRSDIRRFLQQTTSIYDVILINLPAPVTLGFNRFYTTEFFETLKKHTNRESIICTSLPTTANYAEENVRDVNASLYKTLNIHFQEVKIIQGEKNYFLASQEPLGTGLTQMIDQKGLSNEYVNSFYFDDSLLEQRSRLLASEFSTGGKINRDFYPYIFLKEVNHWLSHFGISYRLLVFIPVLLFILLFFRFNPVSKGLYTGGFTAASMEIVLMLAYQVFFGSLYLAIAFFFAVFMAGLASGSYAGPRIPSSSPIKTYYLLQTAIALYALVILFFILLIHPFSHTGFLLQFFFFLLTFILSFSIGFEFYLASELQPLSVRNTSGLNYSTDLTGSALGAFLTALVLLPWAGIVTTCLLIAGLNLLSAVFAFSVRRSF